MGEIKRAVKTIEVNYVCDKCNHGMLHVCGDAEPETHKIPHKCMICGHEQMFEGLSYPRFDYIGENDNF